MSPPVTGASVREVQVEGTADQDSDDEQVGEDEKPLDEHEPPGELLRVGDVEGGRVGHRPQGERRVAVGAEGEVAVVADAPGPAQDADVEVEQATGIAPGQQDAYAGRDGGEDERRPQHGQDQDVGNEQDPLHDPQPATRDGLDAGGDSERVVLVGGGRGAAGGTPRSADLRKARTAPTRQSAPRASKARAMGVRYAMRAPALVVTSSGAVPSRFMITSDHRPSSTGQVRCWRPVPALEATQKDC